MSNAKLLDCTLRDGAYLIDKKFGDTTIRGMINGLIKANVDFIEIGFFQDDGFGEGKTVFRNSADAKRFIPEDRGNAEFTVLADYSRFSMANLDERMEGSIDAVRECFFKKERFDAMEACRTIKEKGYKLFVQPVDILGYSDIELVEFLQMVNEVEPYCLSIVDTFGSMYQEDLHRVFHLIDHNLIHTCRIGFHSHNNMQLSNALSQEFLRLASGKRDVVVDGTISGMGRGAGNTPTELIAQYMDAKLGYSFDMDALLDIIDSYMNNIRTRCTWGYSTPYFVAGCFGAHVNNIAYLMEKNSIRSKDIRYILNKIGAIPRKRYHYDLLEQTYLDYLSSDIDDHEVLEALSNEMRGKDVLIIAPGSTVRKEADRIKRYIVDKKPILIYVNFFDSDYPADYLYMSNAKRYHYWEHAEGFSAIRKITISNIKSTTDDPNEKIISFHRLIKCGWEHMDNSTILLLRLLDLFDLNSIAIAGFDGYSYHIEGRTENYVTEDLELSNIDGDPKEINEEIAAMLSDYFETRTKHTPIGLITSSRFEHCFEKLYES